MFALLTLICHELMQSMCGDHRKDLVTFAGATRNWAQSCRTRFKSATLALMNRQQFAWTVTTDRTSLLIWQKPLKNRVSRNRALIPNSVRTPSHVICCKTSCSFRPVELSFNSYHFSNNEMVLLLDFTK